MSDRNADVVRFVNLAHDTLDELSYYKLLGVEQKSTDREIRAAYYKRAARLHPDLFGKTLEEDFHRKLMAVYSRVVEAYKVLSDAERRKLYDTTLMTGRTRLTADAEARAKSRRKRPEDRVYNPGAKKFYLLGMEALRNGDKKSAATNFKIALSMEPTNPVIKEALAQAEGK